MENENSTSDGAYNVPSATRFRSHASINRASLSSRHYNPARVRLYVYVYMRVCESACVVTLGLYSQDKRRGRGAPAAKLKSTRPLLVCRNLLTRRFALPQPTLHVAQPTGKL